MTLEQTIQSSNLETDYAGAAAAGLLKRRTFQLTPYLFILPAVIFRAWQRGNFGTYFINSVIVTVPSVAGVLAISSLAGYAFARFKFKGSALLFNFLLIGIMVPPQAIAISSFQVISRLGLMDSHLALILTYWSWSPVGILILTTFFRSVPIDMEEAARIDGAGPLQTFWHVALPMAQPALATIAIFYFVWIWNDFLYPLLYLQTETLNTIPLGLMLFNGRFQVDWGIQTAALSLAVFVPFTFYMLFQDRFVKGLTSGAVKG